MKKAKTALVAWVKGLFGVLQHFILWIFTDVGEDFQAFSENQNYSEKNGAFSEDDSSAILKAVLLSGRW